MAKGWYIVHTYSGYEQKIQRTIMKLREMDDDFALIVTDVKVPMETVTEIKDGKKKEVKHKLLPGYILVEIDFPEDATWKNTYSKIKRIQGVTGFVSAMDGRKPLAILAYSFDQIKEYIDIVNDKTFELVNKYWPGAVTFIFKKKESFKYPLDTIAFRVPNSKIALEILKEFGPLATTSVNLSGEEPINDI